MFSKMLKMNLLSALLIIFLLKISIIMCKLDEFNLPDENFEITNSLELSGGKAQRYQFPYQISVQQNTNDDYNHIGSGTILSFNWIITTAYCVTPLQGTYRVVAGLLMQDETHSDIQREIVENIILHPNYTEKKLDYDIALLKLKKVLNPTLSVQPIFVNKEDDDLIFGLATLSSWNIFSGDTRLYYQIVDILNTTVCSNLISDTVLCSKMNPNTNNSSGENGSPLVINGRLVGIKTSGPGTRGFGTYAKVASVLDFLQTYLNN